jgi:hypothetical protein
MPKIVIPALVQEKGLIGIDFARDQVSDLKLMKGEIELKD